MAYKNRNSFIKNISSIGKSTLGLLGGVSFVPSDYGYGGTDLYSGRYCKYGTSCLDGKWGAERYDTDYKHDGSLIPFAKAYLCPIPNRASEYPTSRGNKRVSSGIYYLRYDSSNHYLYGGTSSNPTTRIGYGPIVFIDMVGGGGGGGGTYTWTSVSLISGAGGGGGAYCNLALDLRITGNVTIEIGAAGAAGDPNDGIGKAGSNGGDTILTTASGVIVTAGGGKGGLPGYGEGSTWDDKDPIINGRGGRSSITPDNYSSLGVLRYQYYYGKPGGKGKMNPGSGEHLSGNSGGSFIATDTIYNYGIVDDRSVVTSACGNGSSGAWANTSKNRSVAGGGGGASVLANGDSQSRGSGGDGGSSSSGWWLGEDLGYSSATSGGSGYLILHYATSL